MSYEDAKRLAKSETLPVRDTHLLQHAKLKKGNYLMRFKKRRDDLVICELCILQAHFTRISIVV